MLQQQTIRCLEQQNHALQNNLPGAQSIAGTLGIVIVIPGNAGSFARLSQ